MTIFKRLSLFTTLSLALIFIAGQTNAQQIANYSFGKYGSAEYEYFSFWIKNHRPGNIDYSYGKTNHQYHLTYLGRGNYKGKRAFTITSPNNKALYVIPVGLKLRVASADGKYNKLLSWAYEGPIDGVGTFCKECAQDDKQAIIIIDKYLNFQ